MSASKFPRQTSDRPRIRLMVRLVIASLIFLAPLLLARIPAIGLGLAAQGETWQPGGLQGETVLALEITGSGAERVVYAETRTGLWRDAAADSPSTPRGGQSWRRVDAGLPVTPLGGPALAVWRTVPGRAAGLYALTGTGTARQIFRSDDGGDTWQLIGPAPGQIERPPMVVLAGANGAPDSITLAGDSRVQRSTDGGQTWVPGGAWPAVNSKAEPDRPTSQPPAVRHTIHRLLGESNAPDRLYALADDGAFWLSESGGRAWRSISAPIAVPADPGIGGAAAGRPVTALALMPYFGVRIWATTADAIGFSTDNGANWTIQPLPPTTFGAQPGISALLADPRVPATVYAALGQIIYRSDDAGVTWTSLGSAGGWEITALALDTDTRRVLYAAGEDGVWVRRVVPIAPAALAEMPTAVPTETVSPISNLQSPTSSFAATPTETALPPTETPPPQPSQTPAPTATVSPAPTRTPTATLPPTTEPTPSPTAAPPTVRPPVATATEPPPPPPTAEPRPTATPRPPTAEPPTAEPRPTTLPLPETPRPTPVPR